MHLSIRSNGQLDGTHFVSFQIEQIRYLHVRIAHLALANFEWQNEM